MTLAAFPAHCAPQLLSCFVFTALAVHRSPVWPQVASLVHTQAGTQCAEHTYWTSLPLLSRFTMCGKVCSCMQPHICTHFHLPAIFAAGHELARSVKQASRGASVNLRCEGSPAGPQSFYKTEFCERHDKAAKELGLEAHPEAYAMVSALPPAADPPVTDSVAR